MVTNHSGYYDLVIPSLQKLSMIFEKRKCSLVKGCRNFLCSTKTSDWTLNLFSTGKMMKLFAATGHHIRTESSHV